MTEWKNIPVSDITDVYKNNMYIVVLIRYTGFISRICTVSIKCTRWVKKYMHWGRRSGRYWETAGVGGARSHA